MTEQGKMTDAEIVESYISDLHRKTVVSDCYTPTDGEVLEAWAAHNTPDLPTALDLVGAYDAFKRWLAEHDAKVQAEALREFAHSIPGDVHDARDVADLARGVADHIEKEAGL